MSEPMAEQSVSARTRRAKKACTECRQQKARCDVSDGIPCTRCRKVSAICIISDPFKRENKRQKLDDLKHETQELRDRLKSISGSNGLAISKADDGSSGELSPISMQPSTDNNIDNTKTQARTIDNINLGASEIDELFQLYFSEFSQYLPILDPQKPPNAYYDSSTFLFWSIIGVSCRAHPKSKTFLMTLRSGVCDLAFDSLKTAPTIESIQGLLHVVSWPFPKKNAIWNPTFALLGAVLHCAMNIGLHIPSSYQEFYKHRSQFTEGDVAQRAKIWAHCVMVYQRIIICKGSSAFTLNDFCQDPKARSVLFERLDNSINLRVQLRDTISQGLRAFAECGLQEMSPSQNHVLKGLIGKYQVQLDNLRPPSLSLIDDLDFVSGGLILQMFHLFRDDLVEDTEPITKLFTCACLCLERLDKLSDLSQVGLRAMPVVHQYTLLNASQILLRIYKTPAFSVCVNETRAKAMVLLAVNLAKKMSVSDEDLPARAVTALEDVIDSKKAFRNLNGDGLPTSLRVRSRGAMSILLDGLIWWREEFGGTMGIYPIPLKPSGSMSLSKAGSTPNGTMSTAPVTFPGLDDAFNSTLDSFFSEHTWMGFEDLLSTSQFGGFSGPGIENNYLL